MVRRLEQCGSCGRRFIVQSAAQPPKRRRCPCPCVVDGDDSTTASSSLPVLSTTLAPRSYPDQTNEATSHDMTEDLLFMDDDSKNDEDGDDSSSSVASIDDDNDESICQRTTTQATEAAHKNSNNHNEGLVNKFTRDDIDEEDDDEDLPLAQLIARRNGVMKNAINQPTSSLVSSPGIPIQPNENSSKENEEVVEPILDTSVAPGLPQDDEDNQNLSVCNICGSSLLHIASWNGRLQHVKRCSQKHGVTVAHTLDTDPLIQQQENVPPQSLSAKPTSINEILMAGARRKAIQERHKAEAATRRKTTATQRPQRRRGWSQRPTRSGPCPAYKRIPHTDFVVDGFYYAQPSLTSNYFLTHFHADHYGGLTKSWSAGIIYCSSVTANLIQQQLGVQSKFVHVLPMNQTVTLETRAGRKVKVTLVDANHCPGAVLLFFQVGDHTVLHVGDFRWNRAQHLSPIRSLLQGSRLDQIYLDTTYCDPKYVLPTQGDAIAAAVDFATAQIQEAKRNHQRILLLFGAYTIGKERIYLAVAKALGMKVYVDSRRFRILQALEWPEEQRAMITKNSNETSLWVVPLGHISMKKLPSYQTVKLGRTEVTFDRVVGFRPTGWSLRSGNSRSKKSNHSELLTVCKRGPLTTCSVPYSEHSAFPELVDCLACLQPRIIVPTVSVQKSQAQISLLLEHLERA